MLAFVLTIVSGIVVWYIQQYYEPSFIRFVLVIIGYELITIPLGYFLLIDKPTRKKLNIMIKNCILK